ncbi:hypothetical protein GGR57DRAFT_463617 [Xylariaceae sp. FL1272]|nr:hypothetical protein GGR57DRAFT_463617 [Xylariaceae sp. FL1272]
MADMSQTPMLATNADKEAPPAVPSVPEDQTSDTSKPPPKKRRRIVISCTECHRRKQKCDRKLPCTNCVSRKKASACRYETGAPTVKQPPNRNVASPLSSSHDALSDNTEINKNTKAADFGYSTNAGSTLGLLRRIEGAGSGEPLAGMLTDGQQEVSLDMRDRYKSLIRQLPARTHVERLIDIYFHDVNWHYSGVDETLLRGLLGRWYSIPFSVLSSAGPLALDPMLRALPALLFQMVATAILYLPTDVEKSFDCLKFTDNMTFDDLAVEYSETGMSIASLLGKRQMSVITVLAGWTRASLLKSTGMVTEAWHQIGTCIRDAQGIGLDRDSLDPQPNALDSSEEAMEKLWMAQQRRVIWLLLVSWDLHTGAVLGRPSSVDHRLVNRTYPLDAKATKDPAHSPLIPRTIDDAPTPLTRTIWAWEIMSQLRDILDLEKEGPLPKDFSRVDKLHADIQDLRDRTPPCFRLHNPDTRFDDLPECWWIPCIRAQFPQLCAFNTLALHRPYVFTRSVSRYAALKASLEMLESQRLQYAVLNTAQHRTYALFFGTFDAVVMVASIYILFPREHPELLEESRQHFQWAVDRFEKMAERNQLARSALGVLQAIWIRFKKAVGRGFVACKCSQHAQAETEAATNWLESAARQHGMNASASPSTTDTSLPNTEATRPPSSQGTGHTSTSIQSERSGLVGPDWSLPTDFDLSGIMPMYPMGDIAYNDLMGVLSDAGPVVGGPARTGSWHEERHSSTPRPHHNRAMGIPGLHTMPPGQEQIPWQFGGEFGIDTIWNVLNQFPSNYEDPSDMVPRR